MLSIPHLIIIFVVALVVFGPEKLPDLARNLGKLMGEFRRATGDLRTTFEGHLRDLEHEADQRRIANPNPPPPLPSSLAEVDAAMNTVPATPPYAAAAGAAEDEFPSQPASAADHSSSEPVGGESNEGSKSGSENQTEALSDGGKHTA